MQQKIGPILTARFCAQTDSQVNKSVNDLIDLVGQEAVCAALTMENLEYTCRQVYSHGLYIQQQIVVAFLEVFAPKDPHVMHYYIVRLALSEIDQEALGDDAIVDALARELIVACRSMLIKIKSHTSYFNQVMTTISRQYEPESMPPIIQLDSGFDMEGINASCIKGDLFIWDTAWLEVIRSTGIHGETTTKACKEPRARQLAKYKANKSLALGFWVNYNSSEKDPFYKSIALIKLTKSIYEDKLKRHFQFKKKQLPALPKGDSEDIIKILSPCKKIEICGEDNMQLISHNKEVLGVLSIPSIPHDVLKYVTGGILDLSKKNGHRFLRYLIRTCFNQMCDCVAEHRVIRSPGGWRQICRSMELYSDRYISEVKKIAYAMAFFHWSFPHGSGNLITLNTFRPPNSFKEEGIEITVGPMLLPYRTFEKMGSQRILVPIADDPPLVGAHCYHAGQYQFQNYLMQEFSIKSIDLINQESIEIEDGQFNRWASLSGILPIKEKVIDRLLNDGNDGPAFLKKLGSNRFTLAESQSKILEFLKQGAQIRIRNSKRGKASARKRCRNVD